MYLSLDSSNLRLINKTMLNKISYKLTNLIFLIVEFVCEGDSFFQNRIENLLHECKKIHKFARTKCINNKLFT